MMGLPQNTNDLLDELHSAAEDPGRNSQGWYCCDCGKLIARAADEIERLLKENKQIRDDFEQHECPVCCLRIWKTNTEYVDGTPAGCPECERVAGVFEIKRLRALVAPAIAANIWLFQHGDESDRATVACDLNRALCAINDSQPAEETE